MSKRIQKKRYKKDIINELQSYGYSVNKKTERMTVAELEATAKKKKKQYTQNQRRKQNTEAWQQLGIDKKIISQYDLRNKNPDRVSEGVLSEIKKASRKAKYNRTRLENIERRKDYLISQGVPEEHLTYQITRSDDMMYNFLGRVNPNKVYASDVFLGISFTSVNGSSIFDTSNYRNYTFDELKEGIRQRIADAQNAPDDSSMISLVFDITAGTEGECEEHLIAMSQRGYNLSLGKLTDRRYNRLVKRNDWTMREFAEMTLCILEQVHNRDVLHIVEDLQTFLAMSGLPFQEIFE